MSSSIIEILDRAKTNLLSEKSNIIRDIEECKSKLTEYTLDIESVDQRIKDIDDAINILQEKLDGKSKNKKVKSKRSST